jgi:hypothetical protein
MTLLLLNGAAGAWDELAIALIAFGVLWVAVKLVGRRPTGQDEDAALDELAVGEEHEESANPPAKPLD